MSSVDLAIYKNHLKSIKWYCKIQKEHTRKMMEIRNDFPESLVAVHGSIIALEHACEKLEEINTWLQQ